MIDLTHRSAQKELLDSEDISFADIKENMQELNTVNALLGGHATSLAGVHSMYENERDFHVCEIGCGGGDNLKAISRKYPAISLSGIDLKKECIGYAEQKYPELNATWLASDYRKAGFNAYVPSIIFSSLFCHHFENDELVIMLKWMHENSKKGFFINDLQRSRTAYYLIKWLSAIFSKSYLVKHDACVSVARSFRKKEWRELFGKAGLTNYTIRWRWAFRYLIVCKK